MYAHQIISDLKKEPFGYKYSINEENINHLVDEFKNAQYFHFNDGEGLRKIFQDTYEKNNRMMFLDSEIKHLPYKSCCFTWGKDVGLDRKGPSAILLKEITPPKFHKVQFVIMCAFSHESRWYLNPFGFRVYVNHSPFHNGKNLIPYKLIEKEMDPLDVKFLLEEAQYQLSNGHSFLELLSCKNITTEKTLPSKKLNQSRKKKGKTELYTYHTLKLILPKTRKVYPASDQEAQYHHRIHLCRGHFKRYTSEKPLLGKHTGLYWWQPTVRGKDHKGIVVKDYSLINN